MPPPTLSATLPDWLGPWLAMIGFGAFHGLNPGMGWLFALSLGLQQNSGRAVWIALFPIAAGHAASVALVAACVLAGLHFISLSAVQWITALLLIAFGIYKLFNYYRHPRWVGMKVGPGDLFSWSFLMATAHGAGLMVVPALLGVATAGHGHGAPDTNPPVNVVLAVGVHTFAMWLVMGAVAWVVYRKLGLAVLRRNWINFDLIWAVSLLVVGAIALVTAL
ncbi:MAG: hypothetical protein OXH06_00380 [Gemmatimonadetes bacterium]|nr:hypothetical protein [Gemmatimonadota bacterium]